ncbi:MAG: DUF6111 family protein [Magnetospiraceae bacterium]
MRLFLQILIPLVAPFAVYVAWALYANRGADKKLPHWEDGPYFWLFVAGAVLCIGSFVAFALTSGADPDAVYTAPVFKDGQIQPGHFDPPSAPPAQ